ncbi:hypothetical protein AWB64_05313 [Caballeronia sordidicola]|uniref:DUF1440 domain-containing protein n=1 Tax=Caballeronia sordidicola TaxID=196367 RepID=A0A158I2L7_CABSO|nr:hypothetical protein [Caballeronia sordidicola]SAL50280.1 hypothetical protein AWB64_05313 [Caballeronia sordidicola]
MKIASLLARAFASGAGAAITSAAVASREAVNNGASAVAPMNAVSHCIWPAEAFLDERASMRLTGTGALIHLGASMFWGALFETLLGRRASPAGIVGAAAVTAATAYVVDYHVVPERVTPGFEAHVSSRSFLPIYAALGAGFALVALSRSRPQQPAR